MNRDQAIKSLGLETGCSDEELRAKWSNLDSRNRQKLAAASDEASRQKYEEQLSALDEVAAVLWPTKSEAQAAAEEPAVNTNAASISDAPLAADAANALGASPQPDELVKETVPASRHVASPLSQTQMRDLPVPSLNNNAGLDNGPARIGSDRPSGGVSPLSLTMQADMPAVEQLDTSPKSQADTSPKSGGAMSTDHVGQVLSDRYELRREIGRGGMGVVYAALDRVRGEEIAVKCLAPHLMADEKARQRFIEEARLASMLSHPNVVRVFDIGQSGGTSFLTMELLQGRSLREDILQRKDSHKRFTVEEVRAIGRQLCDALGYAHQQQLVHRDVKPENIWLCEDGTVKLMDFGIARLLSPSKLFTTNMALGTAYYMAPEQLRGDSNIDHRADQFALAVVLYEMLTDHLPQGAVKAPAVLRKNLPLPLSEAVMKGLSGTAAERYADMQSFSRDLHRHAPRRSPWLAASAISAIILVAVGLFIWREPLTAWWHKSLAGESVQSAERAQQLAQAEAAKWEQYLPNLPAGCTEPDEALAAKESLDLGIRMLSEYRYEEAQQQFAKSSEQYAAALAAGQQLASEFGAATEAQQQAEAAKSAWKKYSAESLKGLPIPSEVATADEAMASGKTAFDAQRFTEAKKVFADAQQNYDLAIREGEPIVAAHKNKTQAEVAKSAWEKFVAESLIGLPIPPDVATAEAALASANTAFENRRFAEAEKICAEAQQSYGQAIREGERIVAAHRNKIRAEKKMCETRQAYQSLVSDLLKIGGREVESGRAALADLAEAEKITDLAEQSERYEEIATSFEKAATETEKTLSKLVKDAREAATEALEQWKTEKTEIEDQWTEVERELEIRNKPEAGPFLNREAKKQLAELVTLQNELKKRTQTLETIKAQANESESLREWGSAHVAWRKLGSTSGSSQQDFSDLQRKIATLLRLAKNLPKGILNATRGADAGTVTDVQQSWSEYLRDVDRDGPNGSKMVLIPPGEFMMGTPESELSYLGRHAEDEGLHRVTLTQPFLLGQTEVTKGQFAAFVDDTGYQTEAERDGKGGWGLVKEGFFYSSKKESKFSWRNSGFSQGADEPVVNVSWHDAVAYCNWLSKKAGKPGYYRIEGSTVTPLNNGGYRLPTEAEWEYACRAGSKTAYHFGEDLEMLIRYGNVADQSSRSMLGASSSVAGYDGHATTSAVGSYAGNGFGLRDMHGNVCEWCWDRYGDYPDGLVADPVGLRVGSNRVYRGRSWLDDARDCRSGNRSSGDPSVRYSNLGFRVALSPVE